MLAPPAGLLICTDGGVASTMVSVRVTTAERCKRVSSALACSVNSPGAAVAGASTWKVAV